MLARLIRAPIGIALFCAALLPAAALLIFGPQGVPALLANPAWIQRLFSEAARALLTLMLGWPLGVLAASGLWRASPGARRVVLGLALVSLLTPSAWSDHGLLIVAARLHLTHGALIARLTVLVVQNAAITLFVLTSALNRLDPAMLQTAAAAGATPRWARARVMRPLLRAPLSVAALVAFGFSLARDPAAWGLEVVVLGVCFLV